MLLGNKDLEIRDLCRKHNWNLVEVERYRKYFEAFDTDGGGDIDVEEFKDIIRECARVPKTVEIPPQRLEQLWKECDADGSGSVDFEEFVIFYRKYFVVCGVECDPFADFYANIRPR
eukprot:TRINITY_DN21769_c0_g1_i1.p2 TRINITY_DN21769_c0_g1~~TRINITY_DN21769_c0_g1_i1.p2  ORF type:complete len:117 (-),score=35.17 TRINITY_DN21769_c0_g1_i1:271-621(-)